MFLIIIQLLCLIPICNSKVESKIYVLVDESHNQFFSYSNGNLEYSLEYLNSSGNYIVKLNVIKEPNE